MEVKGNFINYGSYVDVHDNERVYLSVEKGKVKIDEAKEMEAEAEKMEADAEKMEADAEKAEAEAEKAEAKVSANRLIADTINGMKTSGELKKMGDWGLLMIAMNQTGDMPDFATPRSYVDYLSLELKIEGVPCESSISKMVGKTRGMFPNWTFTDTTDIMETNRRINVGKCFIAAVRKRR